MAEEPETFHLEMLSEVSADISDEEYEDHLGVDIMTVQDFLEHVGLGYLIPYDGSAIIRGGTKDEEYWDWETPIPDDATHIEWYNR